MTAVVLSLDSQGGFGRYEVHLIGEGGKPIGGINVARNAEIARLVAHGPLDATGNATVQLEPTSPPAAAAAAILPTGAVYRVDLRGQAASVPERFHFTVPAVAGPVEAVDYVTDPPATVASSALSVHAADTTLHSAAGGRLAPVVHTQSVAAATWVVTHNLGYHPTVDILTAASEQMFPDVVHSSLNAYAVVFAVPTAGSALSR